VRGYTSALCIQLSGNSTSEAVGWSTPHPHSPPHTAGTGDGASTSASGGTQYQLPGSSAGVAAMALQFEMQGDVKLYSYALMR
jgi:hypothetical protein